MSQRDAEMGAALAALEEDDDDGPAITVAPARNPAQVYSVRIPVERIEQLRTVAGVEGTTPSSLIRKWVIERLDSTPRTATSNVVQIHGASSFRSDFDREMRMSRRVI